LDKNIHLNLSNCEEVIRKYRGSNYPVAKKISKQGKVIVEK